MNSIAIMIILNSKVDAFIERTEKWRKELELLREIILSADLNEEIKWGKPCYTYESSNIIILQPFKNYCSVMFFKGSLLEDPEDILIQPTKNSQAQRQVRFTNVDEVKEVKKILPSYIQRAIKVEREGLQVEFKEPSEMEMPEEFETRLNENPDLRKAFEGLTPGRQKQYLLYFIGAKRASTRERRVERYISKILDGKGMDD